MTSSSLILPCKYSCSALESLKAEGEKNSFGKSGWKIGSTARARNPITPMDAHVTLGGAKLGRATGPSSVEHLAMPRYRHPSTPRHTNGSCKKGKSEGLQLCSHAFSQRQLWTERCHLWLSSPSPSSPLQRSLAWSPSAMCLEFHCCLRLGKIQIMISRTANISLRYFLPSSGGLVTPRASVLNTENTK